LEVGESGMSSVDVTTLIGSSSPGGGFGSSYPARPAVPTAPFGSRIRDAFKGFNYRLGQYIGRFVFFNTMNVEIIRPELAEAPGGYVLAPTHLSHLEPFCLGILVRRKVDWMARVEFFRWRVLALLLRALDAFSVNRHGVPVGAIRTSVRRAREGRAIGIFPEGGVATGRASVIRGGPVKKGACVVAQRAGVPIIPCVVLGTDRLNRVEPWLPFRRARLWVAFGEPLYPAAVTGTLTRRQARDRVAADLQRRYQSLYCELREKYGIVDADVP
jgi:1-acyl-sn-glycerol-3-phosphate acyltransferase